MYFCSHHVIFITEFVSAWRNFKNIFPSPIFIIIFRPEMLKFHSYSILTGDTRVEFVIYCVLRSVPDTCSRICDFYCILTFSSIFFSGKQMKMEGHLDTFLGKKLKPSNTGWDSKQKNIFTKKDKKHFTLMLRWFLKSRILWLTTIFHYFWAPMVTLHTEEVR